MASNIAPIKTRKPTGVVPWPLILLEGPEKTGKSYALAELTKDPRLGNVYWLDMGEGSADEYIAIEGAKYDVVDHDGSYQDIYEQVKAIRHEARRANAAGEKPVVLTIDSMSNLWDMLKDWVTERARVSKAGKKALSFDPNAEVKPANGLWNDANSRHGRIMYMLMTFPGLVVITAKGKEVAVIGPDGNPVPGKKDYRVEAQKNIGFDSSAWVRLSREDAPIVVGCRSVAHGVRPGIDKPLPAPEFSLAWLIFDVLKCDPKTAQVRDVRELTIPIPAEELQDDIANGYQQTHSQRPPREQQQGEDPWASNPAPSTQQRQQQGNGQQQQRQQGNEQRGQQQSQQQQPRQQEPRPGGVAGLGNRIAGQQQAAPDPIAEQNDAEQLIIKIEAATERDVLLQLHAAAAKLAPDFVQLVQEKAIERATELKAAAAAKAAAEQPAADAAPDADQLPIDTTA
jgi:hypothetical protein